MTANTNGITTKKTVRLNERFESIQGEGLLSGRWATFLRFQGCSVGCTWCDTKYTWDFHGGEAWDPEELAAQVSTDFVILTGGEPAQQSPQAMYVLVEALKKQGRFIQVETSGRFWAPWLRLIDWRTISPKPPTYEIHPELLPLANELKYVVDDTFTPDRVPTSVPEGCKVSLQPESNKPDRIEHAVELLRQHQDWRLSLQMHKFLDMR